MLFRSVKDDTPAIDPEKDRRKERVRLSKRRRRGRAQTIITGAEGVIGAPTLARPSAGLTFLGGR